MIHQINMVLSPADALRTESFSEYASKFLKINKSQISFIRLIKRSIDARQHNIKINLTRIFIMNKLSTI